jgi:hypothetical protein
MPSSGWFSARFSPRAEEKEEGYGHPHPERPAATMSDNETAGHAGRMEDMRTAEGGAHAVAAVVGGVVALLATCLVVAGAALLWVSGERDPDNFFTTGPHEFTSPTFAISTDDLEVVADAPRWLFDEDRLGTIRVRASGSEAPLFVGVARTSEVVRFLDNVPHEVATGVGTDPFDVETRQAVGTRAPGTPVSATFWETSTTIEGSGTLVWDVEPGRWGVVIMNADGSAGIDAQLELGAKVGFLVPVGVSFTVGGALIMMIGLGAIVYALLARPIEILPQTTS